MSIFYAHLAGFLSLLYFLKEQKRHVNSLSSTFIFLFETVDKLFFKLYMNILALEAPLFFLGGGAFLQNSCVKQLLTSIIPICLSTWNNWTSTGWIFVKFYSDKIHLWLISARNNALFVMPYRSSWLLTKLLFGWKNLQVKGNRNIFSQIHFSENWAVYNYEKCDRAREAKEIFDILYNMVP